MRTLFAALTVAALTSMSLTGTASAGSTGPIPTGTAALTQNPVYKTGRLATQVCEEPLLRGGDFETVRIYVKTVSACFDRAWGAQLKKAGITFGKPRIVLSYTSRVKTACGVRDTNSVFSLYCKRNKTIYMTVSESGLSNELDSPDMLESLAIGYGYHVQQLTGILAQEARALKGLSKTDALALSAKVSLQNICFAGVFLGSVWDSLGHTKEHGYDYLIGRHSWDADVKGHGKAKNRVYWEQRGFDAVSPGACNTFKAPASTVA
jgi:uncharacterized protein